MGPGVSFESNRTGRRLVLLGEKNFHFESVDGWGFISHAKGTQIVLEEEISVLVPCDNAIPTLHVGPGRINFFVCW